MVDTLLQVRGNPMETNVWMSGLKLLDWARYRMSRIVARQSKANNFTLTFRKHNY